MTNDSNSRRSPLVLVGSRISRTSNLSSVLFRGILKNTRSSFCACSTMLLFLQIVFLNSAPASAFVPFLTHSLHPSRTQSSTPFHLSSTHDATTPNFENVLTHQEARQKVDYLKLFSNNESSTQKTVLVMGGGLAGLSTAKHLVDAGHKPIVIEARDILGGKVAAWKDADGDVSETGLHVWFGAYPHAMNLFEDLNIQDRLQWKQHQMYFAKPGRETKEFTVFDFPPGVPAPFNAAWAILTSDMLSFFEKIQLGIGLVPAYLFGQSYVEEQDKVSVQEWMDQRGIPQSVTDEVFVAMSKALGFIGPDKLSMQCVLIAVNRFLQETSGSRIAFLDGSPTERLCEPLREYIETRGGQVRTNAPVQRILVHPDNHQVVGLLLPHEEVVTADAYVNAMPVDGLKKLLPTPWRSLEYFEKLQKLKGVPVINVHIWFDRKLSTVDNLIFSRSPLLSVYADMSEACREYSSSDRSMLELVLAPAAKYMTKSNNEILEATLLELERLFPEEIRADGSLAKVEKFTCVRTPTSVYETLPNLEDCRPTQRSPISNFFCAGDFSKQRYLASMEGAILSGILAATEVAEASVRGDLDSSPRLQERPPLQEMTTPVVPPMTMYVAQLGQIPVTVEQELEGMSQKS